MKILFTRISEWELEDSVRYYELEYSGLGKKFKDEVRKAVKRIVDYPRAWSVEQGEVRPLVKIIHPSCWSRVLPAALRKRVA